MSKSSASSDPSNSVEFSTPPYGSYPAGKTQPRRQVTTTRIAEMHAAGERIAMLTAYDATFAAMADSAGADCILVGDSLGMVCQGMSSTVAVTLDSMRYHTGCVSQGLARAAGRAMLVSDLPFGCYHGSRDRAMESAVDLLQAGASMVKLEGGGWTTDVVSFLVERGIPVCGHLGLTPQTVSALGGYRVQGREKAAGDRLLADARALQGAGATMLVLEMVPAALASAITAELSSCATIGIGAGNGTAGQVLVMHDMLGVNLGRMPKFVRNFMDGASGIHSAFASYVAAVKDGSFPNNELHAW
ncbi:3-methyl-2-oxobutanoate hydroxymethyltransferase [Cupriavidus sp. UYPR2.512]|uniref:3-methyl-2-oxobutanoate hydroxymethyltransferase n=1 Tax=Cupriavidus sp. UYPR2.512 TaxID=1080187 RepID=UPI00047738FE|nr:3-methyl-2-oxobutanoate hydroxymethyltransferase [Cupriavidus sp. UYPR2.512]UIF91833.1 3-methyl-2-oxobutanoate hydroxymethyltransferase [Cupriavidus necator]